MKQRLVDFLRGVGETDILTGNDWKAMPKLELPDREELLSIQDQEWANYTVPGYSD